MKYYKKAMAGAYYIKKTKIVSTAFVLDVKISVLIKYWENRY